VEDVRQARLGRVRAGCRWCGGEFYVDAECATDPVSCSVCSGSSTGDEGAPMTRSEHHIAHGRHPAAAPATEAVPTPPRPFRAGDAVTRFMRRAGHWT
jgi:hypothetical protein